MRLRQVELLLHAVAETNTQPFTTPKCDQGLRELVARTVLISPGIGEGDQPLQSVLLRLYQNEHRADSEQNQQAESNQADAPKEQHGDRRAHHHHGRTKVRLKQEQHGHGKQNQKRLEEAP